MFHVCRGVDVTTVLKLQNRVAMAVDGVPAHPIEFAFRLVCHCKIPSADRILASSSSSDVRVGRYVAAMPFIPLPTASSSTD